MTSDGKEQAFQLLKESSWLKDLSDDFLRRIAAIMTHGKAEVKCGV